MWFSPFFFFFFIVLKCMYLFSIRLRFHTIDMVYSLKYQGLKRTSGSLELETLYSQNITPIAHSNYVSMSLIFIMEFLYIHKAVLVFVVCVYLITLSLISL
jgi:hypothetical protein